MHKSNYGIGDDPACARQTLNHPEIPCNRKAAAGTPDKCFCGFWIKPDSTPDLAPWRA